MQQASSQQVVWTMAEGERSDARASLSLVASMVLLGASFLLLIAAPVVAERMHLLAARALPAEALQRWVPTAAGAGLALGGGSALVFVLSRLVRDMERRPYACLAPAVGVFAGALLMGLRAKLPFPGVASEHIAVFALALAVLGGAFVQERPLVHRLLGLCLTVFPTLTLVLSVWALSERAQLGAALWSLPSASRVYFIVLGASSSAMAILGLATGFKRGGASAQAPMAKEASFSFAPPSMVVDPGILTREDTLDLSLREDERLLRRRGVPGWVLIMVPVAVLLGVAISAFQAQQTRRADQAHDVPERKLVTAQDVGGPADDAQGAQADSSAPTIESLAVPAAQRGAGATGGAEQAAVAPVQAEASGRAAMEADKPVGGALTLPTSVFEVPRQAARRSQGGTVAPEREVGKAGASAEARSDRQAATAPSEPEQAVAPRARALSDAAQPGSVARRAASKRGKHKAKANPKSRTLSAVKHPVDEAPPAGATAARAEPAKAAPAANVAPAPAPQDDSLEALMDRAVDAVKGQKGQQDVQDDPIFGL